MKTLEMSNLRILKKSSGGKKEARFHKNFNRMTGNNKKKVFLLTINA